MRLIRVENYDSFWLRQMVSFGLLKLGDTSLGLMKMSSEALQRESQTEISFGDNGENNSSRE